MKNKAQELFDKAYKMQEESYQFIYEFLSEHPDFKPKETTLIRELDTTKFDDDLEDVNMLYNKCVGFYEDEVDGWSIVFSDGTKKPVCHYDDYITILMEISDWIYQNAYQEQWENELKPHTLTFENKSILITDPCYIIKDIDWSPSNCGRNLKQLGITNHHTRSTLYGDWGCIVINTDTNETIGKFCADAGLVIVCDYDEFKAYNPGVDDFINECPHCITKIDNFTGKVNFVVKDGQLIITGEGNINFKSAQVS